MINIREFLYNNNIIKKYFTCKKLLLMIFSLVFFNSCSIKKMAVKSVADMLSSGESTVFTGDNDPELIRDALPFTLKFYETILDSVKDSPELYLATGKLFMFYSYAFIQLKAEELPDEMVDTKSKLLKRAKKLFLRSRKYCLQGLELKHPGFTSLINKGKINEALSNMDKDDVPYLYWTGVSWMAAFSIDTFDIELSITKNIAVSMLKKGLELNESFDNGSIHNFFISYYGSMPALMGGSEKKAREHFKRAVTLSKGLSLSPYISLATSVCVKNQNIKEYKSLLKKALSIDINKEPKNRLLNILMKNRAKWLLKHTDKFFISEEK